MSPLYSDPKHENHSSLPIEATWNELSVLTAKRDTHQLDQWIESSLSAIEERLSDFVTPNSLKKSLRSGR